ncbi:MAG: aminodeoxychorismate synthase component I [Bacteroidetes bacterium]|nr:aminodeoxychorismate synthase component I [Bacteroidota bacterium]
MRKDDAIGKINEYAVNKVPFLFVTDFEGLHTVVLTESEARANKIFFRIGGEGNFSSWAGPDGNFMRGTGLSRKFSFIPRPIEFETYQHAFEKISWHLKRGDTYLINLTFPTELQTELSLRNIFELSHAPYKLLFGDHFTVFSPEPFIRINDGIIRSNPMKGTIDASIPDAESRLLSDKKEFFEHNTIVDLIRNDLSMIATSVTVDRFRYIEKIGTNRKDLLQMSSEISGKLPAGYLEHLGEDIFTLLPAGSISGAPKEKTVQIIKEAEADERGFYTGIFGYFNGRDFSSAVMIRFIEKADGRLRFRSGGGITALSDCESEYQELIAKVYVPLV